MGVRANLVASYRGIGVVEVEERPIEPPARGEILLGLHACGLCGTDLFKIRHGTIVPGTVLGHELVGKVVEIGAGVDTVRAGDRVVVPHHVSCGMCRLCLQGNEPLCETFRENLLDPGGFATFVTVRERAVRFALYRFPDALSDAAISFLEPAACVIRGVRRSDVLSRRSVSQFPRCVLIFGGGSMGLLHLLVLKATDPYIRVVVADPVPGRRDLALTLGADAATSPGEESAAAVSAMSEGSGADAVFDTVGGAALLEASLDVLRGGGTTVLFAHAGDGERSSFELNRLFKTEQRLVTTYSSSLRDQREAFELIAGGRLDPSPLVTDRVPLREFSRAVAMVENREALKVLIVPEGNP